MGYKPGDLINIRLFDPKDSNPKDIDDYFNLKIFQPLYSSMHSYNNIHGSLDGIHSYVSCLDVRNNLLLNDNN